MGRTSSTSARTDCMGSWWSGWSRTACNLYSPFAWDGCTQLQRYRPSIVKTTSPSSHKHRVYIELNRLSFDFAPQFDLENEKPSVLSSLSSMHYCHFLWLVCVDLGFGHSARPFCWKNTTVDILKTTHLLRLLVFVCRNCWPFEKIQHSSPSSKFFTDHKEEALLLPGVAF